MMKRILFSMALVCFLTKTNAQCPTLNGAMVNACGVTEGINEFVIFTSGAAANTSTFDVNYGTANNPPSTNRMSGQNATPKTGVGSITATGGCIITFVTSPATLIPANTKVVFIPAATDNNYDLTSACNGTSIYVVYIASATTPSSWTSAGVLANNPAAPGRYLQVTNSATGGCTNSTAVVRSYLGSGWATNADGNFVSWGATGTASYSNGGCNNFVLAQTNINLNAIYANSKANLSWQYKNENEVNKYVIEKSTDGKVFKSISQQKPNGSNAYSFEDAEVLNGTAYYRIKVLVFNGSFTYSDIRTLKINGKNLNINSIYPTPAQNEITLNISNKTATTAQLQIVSSNGKIVQATNQNLVNGNVNKTISVANLATGLYYIKLIANGEVLVEKFAKQ